MMMSSIGSADERAEQLVPEFLVRSVERSLEVYIALGFTLDRRDAGFAALRWGDRRLFLDERLDLPPATGPSRVNIRIIVPDVDRVWLKVQSLGLTIERAIGDRDYGLRDFTVLDPDGYGLRFAGVVATDGSCTALLHD